MSLYSDPPPLRTADEDKPTLLVCWWITIFCAVMIVLRVSGRFVRTEKLFTEDRLAGLALVPLFLRMGCVHYILVHGTNNAQFEGARLSDKELKMKSIASGIVLASRLLYAATLWVFKATILEFFARLITITWEKTYRTSLIYIRCTLAATFAAVVISDLAECQPFNHYWQVVPDPGGQCRQGYAQLITMATCNVLTDLLLVFFPIPIIIRSAMTIKRKVQLTLLFSLSLAIVGVTLYRVPHIVWAHGSQQYRSLMASIELLFATAAANALVLGSFVRDRGVKKKKFKYGSDGTASAEPPSESRRPTMHRHWGSDEDLVRDLGLGVQPELRDMPDSPGIQNPHFTPAPILRKLSDNVYLNNWQFPKRNPSNAERSDDSLLPGEQQSVSRSNSIITPRRVSFFDVGGLLDEPGSSTTRRESNISVLDPLSGGVAQPTVAAGNGRRGSASAALLQDLGGFLTPNFSRPGRSKSKSGTELQPIPQSSHEHESKDSGPRDESQRGPRPETGTGSAQTPELIDAGGLLN